MNNNSPPVQSLYPANGFVFSYPQLPQTNESEVNTFDALHFLADVTNKVSTLSHTRFSFGGGWTKLQNETSNKANVIGQLDAEVGARTHKKISIQKESGFGSLLLSELPEFLPELPDYSLGFIPAAPAIEVKKLTVALPVVTVALPVVLSDSAAKAKALNSKRKRDNETDEAGWKKIIRSAEVALKQADAEQKLKTEELHVAALKKYTTDPQGVLQLQSNSISMNTPRFIAVMNQVTELVTKAHAQISQGVILPSDSSTKETAEKESILTKLHDKNLIVIKQLNEIGAGSNGVAYRVVDLIQGKFLALKTAKNPQKFSNIRNESRILKLIHSAGQKASIQAAPIAEFDMPANGFVAQLSPLYKGDLQEHLTNNPNLPITIKLKYINQLLQGVKGLREAGVWHGDIKLSNIWIDENDNVFIGDFDGAITIDEAMQNMHMPRTFTPITCHLSDIELTDNAIRDKSYELLKEMAIERDLYSISLCIFAILSSTSAKPFKYKYIQQELRWYIHPQANLKDFSIRVKYNKAVSDFIAQMLDHDVIKRPTLTQSIKFWSEINETTALRTLPKTPEVELPSDDECTIVPLRKPAPKAIKVRAPAPIPKTQNHGIQVQTGF